MMFWWSRIAIPLVIASGILTLVCRDDVVAIVLAFLYVTGCNMMYFYIGDLEKYFRKCRDSGSDAWKGLRELWDAKGLFFFAWFLAPVPIIAVNYLALNFVGIDPVALLKNPAYHSAFYWLALGLMLVILTWVVDLISCCMGNFVSRNYSGEYDPWRN